MAIVSRQEFADMCGDDVKLLNVYIQRKKVILHDESGKKIDSENMINLLYKKKRKEINKSKKEDNDLLKHITQAPKKTVIKDSDNEEDDIPPMLNMDFISEEIGGQRSKQGPGITGEDMQSWIRKKMKGDADYIALKVEKEQLLLDKAAGKLVPIEVASNILKGQAKTIFSNFENAIDNIATVFCNVMANGNMEMYARIVEQARKELEVAISRAGADSIKDLDVILTEYSDARPNRF